MVHLNYLVTELHILILQWRVILDPPHLLKTGRNYFKVDMH